MSRNSFKPAWWLRNPHLQTIWPALCRRPINMPLERERLELPDGDFIDLDWIKNSAKPSAAPLVIVLHGLEGSIESHYAKGLLQVIAQQGWRGVFMHFRGCSGEPNRFAKDYHSGETNDVQYLVKQLVEREPEIRLGAVGYSLGGNVILKWLGETGSNSHLKAAIAISVPFELHKAAARIQNGFSKFYQWYFIKCLRERLSCKFRDIPAPLDPNIIEQVSTMFEFDDKITSRLHGFAGVDEYYKAASSRQYLRSIQVPTLIVHSKDDPFMSEDMIPDVAELSQYIQLELTEAGGHVGFVSGKYPWRPEYWLETRIPDFFKEYLNNK